MDKVPHGTINGYKNFKCRCDLCKAANSKAYKARYGNVPADAKHGLVATYRHYGCRCDACREACRIYDSERMRKNAHAREVRAECRRRYRERHPDREKEQCRKAHERRKAQFWEEMQAAQKVRNDAYRLRSKGLEFQTEAEMLAAQGGLCAICRKPDKRKLSIDHCHTTKRIRGLLCRRCNLGLGCFGDDASLMKLAIEYLDKENT